MLHASGRVTLVQHTPPIIPECCCSGRGRVPQRIRVARRSPRCWRQCVRPLAIRVTRACLAALLLEGDLPKLSERLALAAILGSLRPFRVHWATLPRDACGSAGRADRRQRRRHLYINGPSSAPPLSRVFDCATGSRRDPCFDATSLSESVAVRTQDCTPRRRGRGGRVKRISWRPCTGPAAALAPLMYPLE